MTVELSAKVLEHAKPVWRLGTGEADALPPLVADWTRQTGFSGTTGAVLLVPGEGGLAGAVLGIGDGSEPMATGTLASALPSGAWKFADGPAAGDVAFLGLLLGAYSFDRYRKAADSRAIRFECTNADTLASVSRTADAIWFARDLINTPTADMGPDELEAAIRNMAKAHKAKVTAITGDALIDKNFPMIHAVGRAGAQAPRLIELRWGRADAPRITLVGKGVCFDTGGLDIKPASSMLLMKKDMGGAANVLALAKMIMARGLTVNLRVLVPAVENSISASAFRPGDVLTSRLGKTVEIGNTDAEGRLVLADALAWACEEQPELLVDMATLTGAARVALGPDIAPYFTGSDDLAAQYDAVAKGCSDPVWRMPLHDGYVANLSSRIADTNNVTTDGFAGSITAALFLRHFVSDPMRWMHFDVFGWNPKKRPQAPIGGEVHAIRALDALLAARYGAA
jgi:leucyl aminopeptidase